MAAGPAVAVLAGALLFGLGEGYFLVIWLTLRAEVTPDGLMGRIGSAGNVLAQTATAVAMAWMGLTLQFLGGPGTFGLLALLALVLASWVALAHPLPALAR